MRLLASDEGWVGTHGHGRSRGFHPGHRDSRARTRAIGARRQLRCTPRPPPSIGPKGSTRRDAHKASRRILAGVRGFAPTSTRLVVDWLHRRYGVGAVPPPPPSRSCAQATSPRENLAGRRCFWSMGCVFGYRQGPPLKTLSRASRSAVESHGGTFPSCGALSAHAASDGAGRVADASRLGNRVCMGNALDRGYCMERVGMAVDGERLCPRTYRDRVPLGRKICGQHPRARAHLRTWV
jgi:hypothetical protein